MAEKRLEKTRELYKKYDDAWVKCDHKFVDSNICLKCGWKSPDDTPTRLQQIRRNCEIYRESHPDDTGSWADYCVFLVAEVSRLREALDRERQHLSFKAWRGIAEKAEAEVSRLQQENKELVKEYHVAINEPEYAGTRQDWIHRAQAAEQENALLKRSLAMLVTSEKAQDDE